MRGGNRHALVVGDAIYEEDTILRLIDSSGIGTNFSKDKNLLYRKVGDLMDAIVRGVGSQYDMLTSITILGYGFDQESNVPKSLEEMIALQDILKINQMEKVKLYFILMNADLYDRVRQDYSGREVLSYRNAEVFLNTEMLLAEISNIMEGNLDGTGVRMKRPDTLTAVERVALEEKKLEEDAKQVERETLDYEKYVPESRLDRADYVGSPEQRSRVEKIEQEREFAVRIAKKYDLDYYVDDWGDIDVYNNEGYVIEDLDVFDKEERNRRRSKKASRKQKEKGRSQERGRSREREDVREDRVYKEEREPVRDEPEARESRRRGSIEQTYPKGNSSSVKRESPIKKYREVEEGIKVTDRELGGDNREVRLARVKMMYNDLFSDGMGVIEDKLSEDSTVMAISSIKGSGGSGLTAQIAEIYAMLGRKVIIIDLDMNGRGQTYYFNNYDKRVSENRGIANSLTNVVEGGVIHSSSVEINSRIDVCGISTSISNIAEDYKDTISRKLDSIIKDAEEFYDIVLLDVPIEDFDQYMNSRLLDIERYLFVVENKEYEVDRLFREYIGEFINNNALLVEEILNNSTIVLNKYNPLNRDSEGYLIDSKWLKEKLYDKGTPYDMMLVGGEVPYAEGFEEQYITGKRYVWQDSGYMATIKNVLKGAV